MGKLSSISACALLAVVLSVLPDAAHAAMDDWAWVFSSWSDFQSSGTSCLAGVSPQASDGWDALDRVVVAPSPRAFCATHHVYGTDGWLGETGFYRVDKRLPLPSEAGASCSWPVYVWADPTLPATATQMWLGWTYGGSAVPSQLDARVTLISKPAGITGGPAVGTVYNLSQQPHGGVSLPVFWTANGLEGYVFDFTATVIPEPSSLLGLAAFLAPVAGLALRRRK